MSTFNDASRVDTNRCIRLVADTLLDGWLKIIERLYAIFRLAADPEWGDTLHRRSSHAVEKRLTVKSRQR
jgi:hypothetical protein